MRRIRLWTLPVPRSTVTVKFAVPVLLWSVGGVVGCAGVAHNLMSVDAFRVAPAEVRRQEGRPAGHDAVERPRRRC